MAKPWSKPTVTSKPAPGKDISPKPPPPKPPPAKGK